MSNEFFQKLIATFNIESNDRLQNISDTLLALENEKNPEIVKDQIEIVFREVHSLKSSSRAINLKKVEEICQALEDVLSTWKQNKTIPSSKQLDTIHKTNDIIIKLISNPSEEESEQITQEILQLKNDLKKINSVTLKVTTPETSRKIIDTNKISIASNHASDSLQTIHIASSKLDALFVQAEEMLSMKLNLIKNVDALFELNSKIVSEKKELRNVIQDTSFLKKISSENHGDFSHLLPSFNKMLEFIESNEKLLSEVSLNVNSISHAIGNGLHVFSTQLDALLENTKKILMWPFTTLLKTFPKIVRDISRTLGKEINFTMEGGEIEIDKRILEEMKDVLLHIIRNAIDHGIEDPKTRKSLEKPMIGNLSIKVEQISGNEILLTISDDGAGIDLEAIKKSAIKLGILSPDEAENIPDEMALDLIYQSGVSSSAILTDLSGRGLGMAIIREKIEKISGKISIQSIINKGTIIKISLPLMIATFKGTLINVSDQLFIIPTANLERTFRIRPENITSVENRDTIVYNNKVTSLIWMSDMLSFPRKKLNSDYLSLVMITGSDKKIAFVVDDILHEQEIIVKNFRKPLARVRNIAAASILETGKPVLILNTSDLLNSIKGDVQRSTIKTAEQENKYLKHILLVEDSITTRMVLKNIFELSGFQVTACADGMEAWTTVRTQNFSAIVSDVDMPKMNGFELTEKIRSDNALSHLPVILVTARESNEDRTRGIDVGANAYITKSNFEGNMLVDVVQRLII